MKYCNDYAALLDLYVDGELSTDDMIRVQEHLASCLGCQAYADDALAMRAAFPDAEDTVVPDSFTATVMESVRANPRPQKKRTPWLKVLAPLAACFALVVLLRQMPVGNGSTNMLAKSFTSMAPAAEEQMVEITAESAFDYSADRAETKAEAAAPEPEVESIPVEITMVDPTEDKQSSSDEHVSEGFATPEAGAGSETVYHTVLFLPSEAAKLLSDFTPVEETNTEVRYHLSMADCTLVQNRLKEADISYMAENGIEPTVHMALVILSK